MHGQWINIISSDRSFHQTYVYITWDIQFPFCGYKWGCNLYFEKGVYSNFMEHTLPLMPSYVWAHTLDNAKCRPDDEGSTSPYLLTLTDPLGEAQ